MLGIEPKSSGKAACAPINVNTIYRENKIQIINYIEKLNQVYVLHKLCPLVIKIQE